MVEGGQADSAGGDVMLPALRTTSSPNADDSIAIGVARFEGLCRASASDISRRFFSASPAVVALEMVQSELRRAEEKMREKGIHCPFAGEDWANSLTAVCTHSRLNHVFQVERTTCTLRVRCPCRPPKVGMTMPMDQAPAHVGRILVSYLGTACTYASASMGVIFTFLVP
jgi:hypothetical protein